MGMDTGYATSPFGILKILEFICLLIAWACIADIRKGGGWIGWKGYRSSRARFFLAITIIAWILVIIWFCCYLFMLCGKLSFPNKMIIFAIIHLVTFVLLLISGALVADDHVAFDGWCGAGNDFCDILAVGAAFGLIAAILFLIDAFIHWKGDKVGVTELPGGGECGAGGGGRTVKTKRTKTTTTITTIA